MYEVNGIVYAGGFEENIKIINARLTDDYMLLLTFSNNEKRVFDAAVLVGSVFEPLKDASVFENFKVVHGVVTWMDEEIDCAPEFMYQNSYAYDEVIV